MAKRTGAKNWGQQPDTKAKSKKKAQFLHKQKRRDKRKNAFESENWTDRAPDQESPDQTSKLSTLFK